LRERKSVGALHRTRAFVTGGEYETVTMSGYKGHIAAGTVYYAVLVAAALLVLPRAAGVNSDLFTRNWWDIPAQLAVAVLAALWPDVDTASQGRNLFYRLFLAFDIFCIVSGAWEAAAFIGLLAILPAVGKHRGWTHRVWATVLVPLPILIVPLYLAPSGTFRTSPDFARIAIGFPYYLAAVVGYVSHLGADGLLGRFLGTITGTFAPPSGQEACNRASRKT